jgi:uncharacterized membrane protein YhiD involved in acid resistance
MFYFPFINSFQHIEIFLLSLLCLCNLKNKFEIEKNKEQINVEKNIEIERQKIKKYLYDENKYNSSINIQQSIYEFTQEKLEESLKVYSFFYNKTVILKKCFQFNNKSAISLVYFF